MSKITTNDLGDIMPWAEYFSLPPEERPDTLFDNMRQVYHLINGGSDRSFVECGAAVKINGKWHRVGKGVARYVQHQIERVQKDCA